MFVGSVSDNYLTGKLPHFEMTSVIRIHTKEVDISQKLRYYGFLLIIYHLVSFLSFIKTNDLFYGIICLDWIAFFLLLKMCFLLFSGLLKKRSPPPIVKCDIFLIVCFWFLNEVSKLQI